MNQDLLEILVDIFKSCGYSVTISNQRDILVQKNGHLAYVRCAIQPDYEEIKIFSEKIEGCTGIYVTTQKTSGELVNYAAELGIHIWDRDELALQIGRVVLSNIEQKAKNSYSEPEIPETDETNGKIAQVQNQSLKEEKASFETSFLPINYDERKNSKEAEQVEVPKCESYETLNIQSVEPRISKDQSMIIAKPYLSTPKDAILKFVPFWKYKYNIEVEKKFRSKVLSITGEGKGLLNALNKSREELKIEGFGVPTRVPSVEYEVKRPNVDKKQAQKIILDLIIEENTREMRFNNMEGQAIIYEVRSISPKPEEVELDIELVYIPIWEVKGKRNSLEINAYNAKVLEQPMDEDAEFL
jgi:hypothetical protein